jgi:hypothetical protein
MKKWSKEAALKEIDNIISQISEVSKSGRGSEKHIRWWTNTGRIIEEIFGAKSRYYMTLNSYTWSETGARIYQGWDINAEIAASHEHAFLKQLNQAKGLLLAARDELSSSNISDVYQGKNTAHESSLLIKILSLIDTKLRKLIRIMPNKEKEIQDAFENLLVVADIEYEREAPSITYSSKRYIPDFSFTELDLVIEIKLCTSTTTEKALISQINDDILAYQTKFGNIIFIIYDIGQIRDISRFTQSFENNDKVIIKIVKH